MYYGGRLMHRTCHGIAKFSAMILKGYQIYLNFIREHEGLDGETPADRAGIKVEGHYGWR